jgi:lysophospholipase L1-like esterase
MLNLSVPIAKITVKRLALWTLILFPIIFMGLSYWSSIERRIPDWYYWQAELVFLLAFELVYVGVMIAALFGIFVVSFRSAREKRREQRAILMRALLLCVSFFFAVIAAEATCQIWQSRQRAQSAMPIGGLGRDIGRSDVIRLPAPVADIPLPTNFPDSANDREIDLVVLGESSAEGVPYSNWVSLGSLLTWKLSQALPERSIRTHVIARSGDTLERQQRELSRVLHRPDLLIIYCGHNEFTARLADSREMAYYLDDSLPSAWDRFVDQAERLSSVCALIRETADKCRIGIPPATTGVRKLVDVPLYSSLEYDTLLHDFRRRLEAIVSYAERIGALPVLIIPAANDAGFEPSRSSLPAPAKRSQREAFEQEFLAARELEREQHNAAIDRYRSLLASYPGFAETHYRLARLLEEKEAWDEAYEHYVLARDRDGYPARALSALQDIYRDVASRNDCILIDTQVYFRAIGRHGLLDDSLFQDAMHPSLRGQIALAQAVLQGLKARGAFGLPHTGPVPLIDSEECVSHFGIDAGAWRAVSLWGINFNTLTAPLIYDPARRLQARITAAVAAERIAAGEAPESLGLPNIGTPARIPAVPLSVIQGRVARTGDR